MNQLHQWGFKAHFEAPLAPWLALGYQPARVVTEHQHLYRVVGQDLDTLAEVSGKLRHEALSREDFPAVGDWVALQPQADGHAIIHAVLPRTSKFSRRAVGGGTREQIVAANVDTLFLVSGLGPDFNVRRIERYLTLAWESGARPVIVLNKADLADDLPLALATAEAVALGTPVVAVSAASGFGLEALEAHMRPGETVALLGSSGVGKSSLVNRLSGSDHQVVQAVRDADAKGRHTTTHREIVPIRSGALLLDTPGMRELAMWDGEGGLTQTFEDVEAFAADCRFRDCSHAHEPGCAVIAAIEDGTLAEGRLASYLKLKRELAHLERQRDPEALRAERERWKKLSQTARKNSHAKRES